MTDTPGPAGIGGWLLLPIVGLLVSLFVTVEVFQNTTIVLLGPPIWEAFTTPGTLFYHSGWILLIVFGALLQISIMLLSAIGLIAIFKKNKLAPLVMISLYLLGLFLAGIDILLTFNFIFEINQELSSSIAPESIKKFIWMLVIAIIWIPYFLKSKRVKNTFTKEW